MGTFVSGRETRAATGRETRWLSTRRISNARPACRTPARTRTLSSALRAPTPIRSFTSSRSKIRRRGRDHGQQWFRCASGPIPSPNTHVTRGITPWPASSPERAPQTRPRKKPRRRDRSESPKRSLTLSGIVAVPCWAAGGVTRNRLLESIKETVMLDRFSGSMITVAVAAAVGAGLGLMASSSLAIARHKKATPATLVPGPSNATGDRQVYTTIKDIMESVIDPSADALWGAVGTVLDKEGVHELLPKTQEEWLDVRRAAVRIIEGGNLLMMPGREAAPVGTKSDAPGVELEPAQITALIKKNRRNFNAFAKALKVLGLEALRAI